MFNRTIFAPTTGSCTLFALILTTVPYHVFERLSPNVYFCQRFNVSPEGNSLVNHSPSTSLVTQLLFTYIHRIRVSWTHLEESSNTMAWRQCLKKSKQKKKTGSDIWDLLDIRQSLTSELEDVRSRSYKDEEQLGKLVSGEVSFIGHQPLPHNQQHQQGLV